MQNAFITLTYLFLTDCQIHQFRFCKNLAQKTCPGKNYQIGGNETIVPARIAAWRLLSSVYPPPQGAC